jgi:hypothetical protein
MTKRLSIATLFFPWMLVGCPSPSPSVDAGVDTALNAMDVAADDTPPAPDWRGCDPLVPSACGFPFPNDVYTEEDTRTETGLRLHFVGESVPAFTRTLAPFEALDGFSPASSPMTHMLGATTTGLVGQREMERSLLADSKTVLLDLTTGTRVAHFAELDVAYDDVTQQALMIRPATLLETGHRYAVAIRGVVDAAGAALPPSPTFAVLRDGTPSEALAVTERRADYEALLTSLSGAGIERGSLQLAWSFTVGSRTAITGTLLRMRDEALMRGGADGAPFTIDSVEMEPNANLHAIVRGTLRTPLYLTRAEPGGTLRRDAAGNPVAEGEMSIPFWVIIPRSAVDAPVRLVQWGHGLLGSGEEIVAFEALHAFANDRGWAVFATDWQGMASEDVGALVNVATSGDIGRFVAVTDRLQQGILNALLLARAMKGGIARAPELQIGGRSAFDTAIPPRFIGQSQGGIFGGTYMALTTDVDRGILLVPGQSYSFLLQRNRGGWESFSPLFEARYRPLDVQRSLALMQLLWDRAEPSGYTPYVRNNRFPGTPPHEVLMMVAIDDWQVSTLMAHQMARAIGVPSFGPENRDIYAVETVTGPHTGSAMLEVDFGVPHVPDTNRPATGMGDDPHTLIVTPSWVLDTLDDFLVTGVINTTCSGPCSPE